MLKKEGIKISVIGLGYVGLPLAIELNKQFNIIGFDLDEVRVSELNNQYDRTNELSGNNLADLKNLKITTNEINIAESNVYIITVPTPVDKNNKPNLSHIISASEMIARYLKKNDVVIYESTVFPGCTEEICVPILEKESNLSFNLDFFCGYSPE
ncbi:MAG: NAD(P)-binding domain-containing protein, partial [Candidatus Neomarinimicrobiota bacterium]